MTQKTSFKNWDTLGKVGFSWALGFTALCAVMAGLSYKNNRKGLAIADASCAIINAACTLKIGHDARKRAKEIERN